MNQLESKAEEKAAWEIKFYEEEEGYNSLIWTICLFAATIQNQEITLK